MNVPRRIVAEKTLTSLDNVLLARCPNTHRESQVSRRRHPSLSNELKRHDVLFSLHSKLITTCTSKSFQLHLPLTLNHESPRHSPQCVRSKVLLAIFCQKDFPYVRHRFVSRLRRRSSPGKYTHEVLLF